VKKEDFDALKKEIDDLKKEHAETKRMAETPMFIPSGPGGSGVIGIPPPEAASAAQVLTVVNTSDGKKARWAAATGGAGGSSLSGFTVSNGGSTLTYDAQNTSLDELASVVAQIIDQLQP
jgi:hypothetical protein